MISKSIAAALIASNGYWHGPTPVRIYTLENDGTVAGEVWNPAIRRFYIFAWPHWDQNVPIPGYWKPGIPLPKPWITNRVKKKYGHVYFETDDIPEPLPARPLRNDRLPGEMDRFGTVLH